MPMRKFILPVLCIFALATSSCSKKITNDQILKLESREAILKLNTKLNTLKLNLEKEVYKKSALDKKLVKASDDAKVASLNSKSLSEQLNIEPENQKLSKKALKEASRVTSYTKTINQLDGKIAQSNKQIASIQSDIDNTRADLQKLETKINFVPNKS